MSFALPVMYHWSPLGRRSKIIRSGLRASTPTIVDVYEEAVGDRKLQKNCGVETVKAVCLGTSPSHAWSLCGAIWGAEGETWDLWQVSLGADDTVKILESNVGFRLGEVRVCNNIPKGRVWHVGSRTVGSRKWNVAS